MDKAVAPPCRPNVLMATTRKMFGTWYDALISVLSACLLVWVGVKIVDWAFITAVWSNDAADPCKAVPGACWAVITARWRLILFGLFPFDQHWRTATACIVILLVAILSCIPFVWRPARLMTLWLGGFGLFYILMRGGIFGLPLISANDWGGLTLTLFIFASVAIIGMPLAVILAFMRQSDDSVLRGLSGALIDATRALPLLVVLFVAAVILPLGLPDWLQGSKLVLVTLAFALFFACSQAEIIRGGLQAIPAGQYEAATALGLNYWQRAWLILLPQAFRSSLPATVNQFVVTFKDTSIVVILGFFEILASGNAAYGTGQWTGAYVEVYVFIGLIYFAFTFSLSRYGQFLEARMRTGDN